MAARLVLHVGAPKTATSSIQSCLASARDQLAEHGILYPGPDVNHVSQFLAPMNFPGPKYMEQEAPALWHRLKSEVDAHPGTVVLSSEIVCSADVSLGKRLLAELAVPDTEVVLTLRSLDHQLPSTWQEYVKAGDTITFDDWLSSVFGGPPNADTDYFWIAGNMAEMVERWLDIAGVGNLTVIVVDPNDRTRIFRNFEGILALPDGFLQPQPEDLTNRSMTATESELIRRLNVAVAGDQPGRHGYTVLPITALWEILSRQPADDEPRLGLTRHELRRVRQISRSFVARIETSGARILGDLRHLLPSMRPMKRRSTTASVPMDVATALGAALARAPGLDAQNQGWLASE